MAQKISKSQFKPRALELFREVQSTGEPLIITDHGRPVLKIVPYVEDVEPLPGHMRGVVVRYQDPTEPVGELDWEQD